MKSAIHQICIPPRDTLNRQERRLKKRLLINLNQIIKEKTNCNRNYSPQFAFVLSQRRRQQRQKSQNNNNWQPKRQQRPRHRHKSPDFLTHSPWIELLQTSCRFGCRFLLRMPRLLLLPLRLLLPKQMLSIHHLPLCGCHKFIHLFSGHDFIIRSRSSGSLARQLYCVDLQLGCRNSIYTANGRPIKYSLAFHIGGNTKAERLKTATDSGLVKVQVIIASHRIASPPREPSSSSSSAS